MRSPLRRLHLIPLLVALAAGIGPGLASGASTAAEAEHVRLAEEMRKLASRNAWHGVEQQYLRMLALEKDGVNLTYDDHLLGAQAARDLGRITDVYNRLQRAQAVKKTEEVTQWLADIRASYGPVLLVKDQKYVGEAVLVPDQMPFAPDQRAAIGAAQQKLAAESRYDGLLPYGGYTFGGRAFEVKQDEAAPRPEVILAPEGANTRRVARTPERTGLRLALGPGFTMIGGNSEAEVREPAGGTSGASLRAGVGGELQLAKDIGAMLEIGYHGLYGQTIEESVSGADITTQPGSDTYKTRMDLLYIQAAPTFWLDRLGLFAGPSFAFAPGQVTIAGPALCDPSDQNSPQVECVDGATTGGGPLHPKSLNLWGLALGGNYELFDIGRRHGGGLGLHAGTWFDADRAYPWAQLALTITPSL